METVSHGEVVLCGTDLDVWTYGEYLWSCRANNCEALTCEETWEVPLYQLRKKFNASDDQIVIWGTPDRYEFGPFPAKQHAVAILSEKYEHEIAEPDCGGWTD